jgi:hypothetical protein
MAPGQDGAVVTETLWLLADDRGLVPEVTSPVISALVREWASAVSWTCAAEKPAPTVWVGDLRHGHAYCIACASAPAVRDLWARTQDVCAGCAERRDDITTIVVGLESVPPGSEAVVIAGLCPRCQNNTERNE